jgi:hypothetical protein
MKFQVPQFIEVEDKIFGPLTLKQFLYLAGGGAAIFLLYISLPFFLFILTAAPVAALSAALAFYKIHSKPFIKVMENAFHYLTRTKIYTWRKKEKPLKRVRLSKEKADSQLKALGGVPTLTKTKLSDLAWSLDIKKDISNK